MRRSLTSATLTVPVARAGAIRASHLLSAGSTIRRPSSPATSTRSRRLTARDERASPGDFFARAITSAARFRSVATSARRRAAAPVAERKYLVGFHDLLDEPVPHDVALVEIDERDAVDAADHLHRLNQARRPSGRQI